MLPVTLVLAWSLTFEEARIVTLLKDLGDVRFAVRAGAHARLEQMLLSDQGHLHRPCVECAMTHRDLEIARRATLLVEEYYNIRPDNYPVLPWIDMLPAHQANRQGIIDRTLGCARSGPGWGANTDWPDYRYATFLYTSELLRQGCSRKVVRQLLDEMASQERDYREKRGMRPTGSQ